MSTTKGHDDLLRGDLNILHHAAWYWNRVTILLHAFKVIFDSLPYQQFDFPTRLACRYTAWKIGHISRKISISSFDYYRIFHRQPLLPSGLFADTIHSAGRQFITRLTGNSNTPLNRTVFELTVTPNICFPVIWRNKSNDYEFGVWCRFDVILHRHHNLERCSMPRQSISLTGPSSEWLKLKVEIEGEYRSNSEAVNDLIRKAREIEGIRARLIQAEQSGFTEQSRDEIRAEIRKEMRRNGKL